MTNPLARAADTPLAAQLAQFAQALRYEDLPPGVVDRAKLLILDALGCALGAVGCEPVNIVARAMAGGTSAVVATVIGGARKAPLEEAVLINGTLTRYLDYLDVYWREDVSHPGENIPLALACVESVGGNGRSLIESVVVGHEVQIRLCNAFSFQARGFHNASSGGFVAPLVIGKAWRLPATTLAHALALHGARHLTLFALAKGQLSMAKAMGYPLSAMEALLAVRLADNGLTGPLEAMEWLFGRLPGSAAVPVSDLDLDPNRFRLDEVSLKSYPVQFEIQAAVECAVALHGRVGNVIAQVSEIVIKVNAVTRERTADPEKFAPGNRETADHSLPCCVAFALADGGVTPSQFDAQRWLDMDIRALIAKTRVEHDAELEAEFPGGRPASVQLRLCDGRELDAKTGVPRGDAKRPMSRAEVEAKFISLAQTVLGDASAQRVIALVNGIDTADTLDALMDAISYRRG